MDETETYSELEATDLGEELERLNVDNTALKTHILSLEEDIDKLCNKLTDMKKVQSNLEKNISELFKTAKNELGRKDRIIAELRAELENKKQRYRPSTSPNRRSEPPRKLPQKESPKFTQPYERRNFHTAPKRPRDDVSTPSLPRSFKPENGRNSDMARNVYQKRRCEFRLNPYNTMLVDTNSSQKISSPTSSRPKNKNALLKSDLNTENIEVKNEIIKTEANINNFSSLEATMQTTHGMATSNLDSDVNRTTGSNLSLRLETIKNENVNEDIPILKSVPNQVCLKKVTNKLEKNLEVTKMNTNSINEEEDDEDCIILVDDSSDSLLFEEINPSCRNDLDFHNLFEHEPNKQQNRHKTTKKGENSLIIDRVVSSDNCKGVFNKITGNKQLVSSVKESVAIQSKKKEDTDKQMLKDSTGPASNVKQVFNSEEKKEDSRQDEVITFVTGQDNKKTKMPSIRLPETQTADTLNNKTKKNSNLEENSKVKKSLQKERSSKKISSVVTQIHNQVAAASIKNAIINVTDIIKPDVNSIKAVEQEKNLEKLNKNILPQEEEEETRNSTIATLSEKHVHASDNTDLQSTRKIDESIEIETVSRKVTPTTGEGINQKTEIVNEKSDANRNTTDNNNAVHNVTEEMNEVDKPDVGITKKLETEIHENIEVEKVVENGPINITNDNSTNCNTKTTILESILISPNETINQLLSTQDSAHTINVENKKAVEEKLSETLPSRLENADMKLKLEEIKLGKTMEDIIGSVEQPNEPSIKVNVADQEIEVPAKTVVTMPKCDSPKVTPPKTDVSLNNGCTKSTENLNAQVDNSKEEECKFQNSLTDLRTKCDVLAKAEKPDKHLLEGKESGTVANDVKEVSSEANALDKDTETTAEKNEIICSVLKNSQDELSNKLEKIVKEKETQLTNISKPLSGSKKKHCNNKRKRVSYDVPEYKIDNSTHEKKKGIESLESKKTNIPTFNEFVSTSVKAAALEDNEQTLPHINENETDPNKKRDKKKMSVESRVLRNSKQNSRTIENVASAVNSKTEQSLKTPTKSVDTLNTISDKGEEKAQLNKSACVPPILNNSVTKVLNTNITPSVPAKRRRIVIFKMIE